MSNAPRAKTYRPRPARSGAGGASRKVQAPSNRKLRGALIKSLSAVMAVALVVGLILVMEPMAYLKQVTNRPIASIAIKGQFRYLSQQKVQAMVAERVADTFLQLDMHELKAAMEQNPWIDSVAISRHWPDSLVVTVNEQQPIARWGDDAFMNMRGDIIEVADNRILEHLPMLHGGKHYAQDVMQKYVQITRLLSPAELELREVNLDETLSWTLQLQNGIVIRVGREHVFEKLQRLLAVFPRELAAKAERVESIDLRYSDGFAVSWKQKGLEQLAMADGK